MKRLLRSELARRLHVPEAAVRRATRRGELCDGHPVAEWALRRGRQVLYEVPDEVAATLEAPDAGHLKRKSRVIRGFMRGS